MSRYTITESVGSRVLPVHSYEDLHKHHPSSGRQPNREYGTVHGEFEEIRHADGRTFVKKDFILSQDSRGPVEIPAPVSGYAHFLHDDYNTVQIYDKPYGTPGARREGQVLHMVRGSSPFNEGAHIDYGQPLGEMGQTGSPGSIHAHVELEVGQFQRYITDINDGTIRPGVTPRGVGTAPAAGNDHLLADGARGTAVVALQQHLTTLGYADAQGQPLQADGTFGPATRHAVEAFQRDHQLVVDGKVGSHTAAGIDQALASQGVSRLQSGLNRLGYTDARGHALQVDGDFGINTRHAVEAFQRDHQLTVDGKVGPQTQAALDQALKTRAPQTAAPNADAGAVRLDNPAHPDNALYRQAYGLAQRIDAEMGRPSDEHTRRLAAAAVPAAKAQGLTRIDALTLSADGSRTFVTQHDAPMKRMAELSTSQAVATPVEQSSAAALRVDRAATPAPTPQPPAHAQTGAVSGVTLLA
ncbi:peptidoglycan-binding protein [Dyella sp.]|jgi:peptidoglycan hydrolase-like protein with peptidoglycan-binding domain|uniref:peptidoglycan-binding protein n=1 Tax=Dyella sp. TaxID=1869338 RepID=UPI002D79FA3E|nr:peptidoglycan-binding protein [Dyella sp.]HET6431805.1 peptidoglycan-binding protein [Dyella sp.]